MGGSESTPTPTPAPGKKIEINENEIKQTSKMAERLGKMLKKCDETTGDKILVPQDVRERMKELCSETKKLVEDMPNKKFKLKVKLNSSKSLSILKKANECIEKASVNKSSFDKLVAFYGEKNEISKYKTKMYKYCDDLNKIIKNIKDTVNKEKNNELFMDKGLRVKLKEINEKAEIHDEDQTLIDLGRIYINNETSNCKTYEGYIQAFFKKFIDAGFVDTFKKISVALRKLKLTVAINEGNILELGEINISRNFAYGLMKEIRTKVNYFMRKANECINFLNGLPIESPELIEERNKNVDIVKAKINECNRSLNIVNNCKDSILYGETTFYSSNGKSNLAIGSTFKGTFFNANKMRMHCNAFTELLDDIVSCIQGGKDVTYVHDSANDLESKYKLLESSMAGFLNKVSTFQGYFKDNDKNDLKTLQSVNANYNDICGRLLEVNSVVKKTERLDTKLNDMKKAVKKEVEEYNKTSSKIKRGVKKVFGVMGTIARYTLNVTEFLKNVLFISDTWSGLSQSLAKNEKQKTEYVQTPVVMS